MLFLRSTKESMYPRFKNRGIIAPPHPLFFLTRGGLPAGVWNQYRIQKINFPIKTLKRLGRCARHTWNPRAHPSLRSEKKTTPFQGAYDAPFVQQIGVAFQ